MYRLVNSVKWEVYKGAVQDMKRRRVAGWIKLAAWGSLRGVSKFMVGNFRL